MPKIKYNCYLDYDVVCIPPMKMDKEFARKDIRDTIEADNPGLAAKSIKDDLEGDGLDYPDTAYNEGKPVRIIIMEAVSPFSTWAFDFESGECVRPPLPIIGQ